MSYIEFISTYDRKSIEETEHPEHSLMETIVENRFKEGFARFVIRTTDIEKTANHFRNKGLNIVGPVPLSRRSPDGTLIEWKLLFVGEQKKELKLPYFIQWEETDEERKIDLMDKKVLIPHPSGAVLSHIMIAVKDVDEMTKKWADLLGLSIGSQYIDEEIKAKCIPLMLPGCNLVFCSPTKEGIVSRILSNEGEKIFQVELISPVVSHAFKLLGGSYKINRL